MDYDRMETLIAGARDGADALAELMKELDERMLYTITTDTASNFHSLLESLGASISAVTAIPQSQEFTQSFVEQLTPEAFGELTLQFLGSGMMGNPQSPVNKIAAVKVADRLGPDWCQALYHFSVFCTRVA